MSYSEFLSKIINNKGYSLNQISMIAKTKYNSDITPSYISKLKSGKKIASKEVNEIIAKVCEASVEDLQFEADMERCPENVKKSISDLIEASKKIFMMGSENDELGNMLTQALENMSTRQYVDIIAKSSLADFDDKGIDPFNGDITNIFTNKEDIREDISMTVNINYTMEDGSMYPLIKEGSKLMLDNIAEIKNGDIVLAEVDNKTITRFYHKNSNNIILIPMNNKFETITCKENKAIIKAKVKGYIVNL